MIALPRWCLGVGASTSRAAAEPPVRCAVGIAAITGKVTHRLERKLGITPLLVTLALAPALGYFTLGLIGGWIGVAATGLFSVNRGLTSVVLQDALNWRIPSHSRSTANSIGSLAFRLGFALIGPLIGTSVDRDGMDRTLVYLGAAFAVLFPVAMAPLLRRVHALRLSYIPNGSAAPAEATAAERPAELAYAPED